MSIYHHTFRFDAPLPSMQADVMGRWVRGKYRERWHKRVAEQTLGKRPKQPLTQARVRLVRASCTDQNRMDADNLRYSFKAVLDGFVACGLLADDCYAVIGEPEVTTTHAPKGSGWISVEIEG